LAFRVISDGSVSTPIFAAFMVKYVVFILAVLIGANARGQDSLVQPPPDTVKSIPPVVRKPVRKKPLIPKRVAADSLLKQVRDTLPAVLNSAAFSDTMAYRGHPYFRFTGPVRNAVTIRQWQGKEAIFYSMIALLIFFALIKNGFNRYLHDLFKIFFRTTVNQRQIKEQLLQSPLPSLFFNIFFLLSIGMFLALVLRYFKLGGSINFWMLFLYCVFGLVAIYGVKFLSLKLLGWIFQVSEAIDGYIFIVFTTNKVIGITLLPFLVVMAFTYGFINEATMNLGMVLVLGLFAYRFFLSYVSIQRQVRISFFHFLLYLFAFELIPLLLINKLLFRFLGETY
jgi:hypothetical protein